MKLSSLSVRQRVLFACMAVSGAAIAAMTASGLRFRSVLRARARESCTCMAEIFAERARQRILHLVGDAESLARSAALRPAQGRGLVGRRRDSLSSRDGRTPSADKFTAVRAWTVYDAEGQRIDGYCAEGEEAVLAVAGSTGEGLIARERGRLAEAIAGRPSAVLVPDSDGVVALLYRPVRRPGEPPRALQAAGRVADASFSADAACGDVRIVLRPFLTSADEPKVVAIDGKPRMVVQRPLCVAGRQLGTVTAAIPYDAEARSAQQALVIIVLVGLGATLVLALLSYLLTDVAMVPLERVRHLLRNRQANAEVQLEGGCRDDAIASIISSYQEVIDQSQEFADQLMQSNRALRELLLGAVGALVSAIEAKDGYTAGHSQRVAEMACAIARDTGWDFADVEQLRLGALLHDIGKIGISQDILNKPGRLDEAEWELIRQHPVIGARILSTIPGCEDLLRSVLHHHEYYDGSGYPSGIAGEDIPLGARIVAVADVYDALTSKRSYRDAYPVAKALAIMDESSGTMLDSEILAAFLATARAGGSAAAIDGARGPEQQLAAAEAPAARASKGTA